jgi:multidrug efflux pump subunit AcrA (membrane-fusion protein)
MNRAAITSLAASLLLGSILLTGACSAAGKTADRATTATARVSVAPVEASQRLIARFIQATGTLMAEERADVAAETGGRVVAAPIERGTAVGQGAELIQLSPAETDAQAREADANAAQIEARLGVTAEKPFDVDSVPEV